MMLGRNRSEACIADSSCTSWKLLYTSVQIHQCFAWEDSYKRLKKYSPQLSTTDTKKSMMQVDAKGMLRQTEFGMSAGLLSFVCRAIQNGKAGMSKTAIARRTMFWTWVMCDLLLAVTLEKASQNSMQRVSCQFNLRQNI
jgi:hypothetical protein